MSESTAEPIDLTDVNSLKEHWNELDLDQRRSAFQGLARPDAEELFLSRSSHEQVELIIQALLGSPATSR